MFLQFLSVSLGLLRECFKVFDFLLDQGAVLGRSNSKGLKTMLSDI